MTDFRALCEELANRMDSETGYTRPDGTRSSHPAVVRARAALAEQPVGPTDEELKAAYWEAFKNSAACGAEESWLAGLRAVAHWGQPAATPIPVAERLPAPEDCIQRGNDHWCWGQERSFLTGQAAARWRMMRVSSLEDEAVGWLPANALPMPAND